MDHGPGDRFPPVPLPRATISYVLARETAYATVECPDRLEVVTAAFRRCRELRGEGARIVWVEFVTDGIRTRRYVDGRSSGPRVTRPVLDTADEGRNTRPS